jgi:hypothetical protein
MISRMGTTSEHDPEKQSAFFEKIMLEQKDRAGATLPQGKSV